LSSAYFDTRHRKHTKCFSFEQHQKEYRKEKYFYILRYYVKPTGASFIYKKIDLFSETWHYFNNNIKNHMREDVLLHKKFTFGIEIQNP
jgi:hypothetical protein